MYTYIVDPEAEHDSSCNEKLIETSQTTTDGSGCILANVKGGQHACCTHAETRDESSDVKSIAIGLSERNKLDWEEVRLTDILW